MKAISIRIDEKLGREFDALCRQAGYKKNTLLSRLIESFVRYQKQVAGRRRSKDRFVKFIGLMNLKPLLTSSDEIDKAVYDL